MKPDTKTSKALELVKQFRDKARALFRLQNVNTLVEKRQRLEHDLEQAQKQKDTVTSRLAEIAEGKYSVDVNEARNQQRSPEDVIAEVKQELTDSLPAIEENITRQTKNLEDLDLEINVACAGGKDPDGKYNYRAPKSTITRIANELMSSNTDSFDLSDIAQDEEDEDTVARPSL